MRQIDQARDKCFAVTSRGVASCPARFVGIGAAARALNDADYTASPEHTGSRTPSKGRGFVANEVVQLIGFVVSDLDN